MFQRIFSLARHTAIYGPGDLPMRMAAVVLLPIYARHLSLTDNGVVSLSFAFIGCCTVLYSLCINPALLRLLSGKTDLFAHRQAFSSAFWTLLTVGLVLSGVCWSGATYLSEIVLDSKTQGHIFKLIAIIIFFDTLSEPMFTVCWARQQSVRFALGRFAQYAIQLGLTAYFIVGLHRGPEAVILANAISSVFAFIAILPSGLLFLRPVFNTQDLRSLFVFGLPFLPSALSVLIINLSDRFFIRYLLGIQDVGIYGIVCTIGLPVFFVAKAFYAAWAQVVIQATSADETRHMCARITTYFALIGLFLCLMLTTYTQDIIALIAGKNALAYLPGAPVVPIVALSFLGYGFYVILTAGMTGKPRSLPVIVGAITNMVVNLALLPTIGFVAAAWSTLITCGMMAVLLYFHVRQFYPVPYEYARLGKIVITTIIVFLALSGYLHDTTPEGIIARGIFLIGYPLILWGWQFFEPGELQNIGRLFYSIGKIEK